MDEMRSQMEKVMKVVEIRTAAEAMPVKELSMKLVPLTEKDDIEAYLVRTDNGGPQSQGG